MDDNVLTLDLDTSGFNTLKHPGPLFRPIPKFTIKTPPEWVVSEFPSSLCVIATPASSPELWSNAFIQHKRVLRTAALEEIALETWEELKSEFPDAKVKEERVVGFDLFHYVRECTLTYEGEKVTRIDSYVFGPDVEHLTVDLFHFLFLHPVAAGDDRSTVYMKMLSSVRIK